jgi:hypothetical protein
VARPADAGTSAGVASSGTSAGVASSGTSTAAAAAASEDDFEVVTETVTVDDDSDVGTVPPYPPQYSEIITRGYEMFKRLYTVCDGLARTVVVATCASAHFRCCTAFVRYCCR